jgi:hypothetical protein
VSASTLRARFPPTPNHVGALALDSYVEEGPSMAISQGGGVRAPAEQDTQHAQAAGRSGDVHGVGSPVVRLVRRGFVGVEQQLRRRFRPRPDLWKPLAEEPSR